MDAIVKGTAVGLELLLNIIAMLIVLVALVHLANAVLGLLPEVGGPITLQRLLATSWPRCAGCSASHGTRPSLPAR